MNPKKAAAEKAVEYIFDGMTIGLGTGSTAFWAIQKIGERVKAGLNIKAVATSLQSEALALESKIPLVQLSDITTIDLTIDGADEVDANGNLIKGGGGALLREKIIASNSNEFYIVVDEQKHVETLGRFPLPIEVVPFGHQLTLKQIRDYTPKVALRRAGENYFLTDNGNLIADCDFYPITDPVTLDMNLKSIPGVVETGIFPREMVTSVITGFTDGTVRVKTYT